MGKCLQMYSLKKEDNLKYKTSSVKIYTMKNGALVTEFRKIKTEDETIFTPSDIHQVGKRQ